MSTYHEYAINSTGLDDILKFYFEISGDNNNYTLDGENKFYTKECSDYREKETGPSKIIVFDVDKSGNIKFKKNVQYMLNLYYEMDVTLFANNKLDRFKKNDIVIYKFEKKIYIFTINKVLRASDSVIRPCWGKYSKCDVMIYLKDLYKLY